MLNRKKIGSVEPIKAIAKELKGKSYLAIFEERKKRPETEVVLTELDSEGPDVGLPFGSLREAAKFLDVSPSTLSDRKTGKAAPDKPIKAKAKGLEGKRYRATFSTREVS